MEETLGKRIMKNRKRLSLTQDQLAERLGVTAQAVSKWENDLSCPDISILPRLADIFGISTDELLGRQPPAVEAEVVTDQTRDPEGVHIQKGKWEVTVDSGKKCAVGVAVGILAVGILYLLNQLLGWELSFWAIAWPTALLVFGLWHLPRFSFFRLGCALFGGYALLTTLGIVPNVLDSGAMFAVIIVLVGLSLLADALRKTKRAGFHVHRKDTAFQDNGRQTFQVEGEQFTYSSSFSENSQDVWMDRLARGTVSTSFGAHTLDLSGVGAVAEGCKIDANCSFGELVIRVPRRFSVQPVSSTAFAAFDVTGGPDPEPEGVIDLDARVSFGHILIRYI